MGASSLRRYPALGFLAVAAALALLLPSKLSSPRSEPASLAEFAPVPGRADGAGDLSDLGSAESSGAGRAAVARGAGRGSGVGGASQAGGRRPSQLKRCVGDPPRQTEDPLSPPCVAFFEGDNGGATSRGVTRDEVTVVVYRPSTGSGPQPGDVRDFGEPAAPEDTATEAAIKLYAKYFNDRYQTYDRYVHLYGFYGPQFTQPDVIPRRHADAQHVDERFRPFATVPVNANPQVPYLETIRARGVMGITVDGYERAFYQRDPGLQWGVQPDHQDEAALTAAYVCAKLEGGLARHAGDPLDQTRTRRFAIAYTRSPREPEYAQLKDAIKAELARRCGVRIAVEAGASEVFQEGQSQAPGGVAQMRADGVTTVIVPALANTVLNFTSSASAAGWFPEWVVPGRRGLTGPDRTTLAKLFPQEQWRHAFGITYSPRWGDLASQNWSRAYSEACGGCQIRNPYDSSVFYDALQMLFYGVQAAGPRLTPQSFDKGMHAIPARGSTDAHTPAAYFTDRNYSYVKDAMEIWWDPAGRAPGSEGSPGCYRLPDGGARTRADEWRPGDGHLFTGQPPCNGDAPLV